MNRRRRGAALRRFLRWQLASRLWPGPVLSPFVNGTLLVLERGLTAATGNYYCGLLEYEDMAFVLALLRAGDLFADVGANVGSYSLLAASTGCRVVAFEPVPETFARLMRNVKVNGFEARIDARREGVGSEAGELRFTSSLDAVNHVLTPQEQGDASVAVQVRPLDRLGDAPTAIKIDVEGYELAVLAGARGLLQHAGLRAVIIEINGSVRRYGHSEDEVHAALLGHGFRPHRYLPADRRLEPLPSWNSGAGNTLYLRDVPWVERRLATAPRILVNGSAL